MAAKKGKKRDKAWLLAVALDNKDGHRRLTKGDNFILAIPMLSGHRAFSLLVFIGGFSAATAMVMVSSVALGKMEELRLGNLVGHALERADRDDAIDEAGAPHAHISLYRDRSFFCVPCVLSRLKLFNHNEWPRRNAKSTTPNSDSHREQAPIFIASKSLRERRPEGGGLSHRCTRIHTDASWIRCDPVSVNLCASVASTICS